MMNLDTNRAKSRHESRQIAPRIATVSRHESRQYRVRYIAKAVIIRDFVVLPQKRPIIVAIMAKHPSSIDSRVAERIRKLGPGVIFSPGDLAGLGSRTAIASALSRQVQAGMLTQPARGLYQVPATHPALGELLPVPDDVAAALAGKHNLKLQPAGAYAANLLGLSDQVPMKIVYLTDGTPRQVRVGKQQITLRRTTPKNMATAGRISGLVIQAFRHFGQRRVDSTMVESLRRRLSSKDRAQLLEDAQFAPAWIAALMHEIAVGRENI